MRALVLPRVNGRRFSVCFFLFFVITLSFAFLRRFPGVCRGQRGRRRVVRGDSCVLGSCLRTSSGPSGVTRERPTCRGKGTPPRVLLVESPDRVTACLSRKSTFFSFESSRALLRKTANLYRLQCRKNAFHSNFKKIL